MVRNTFNQTRFGGLAAVALTLLAPAAIINNTYAAASCTTDNVTGVRTCEDRGTFQVSVDEILTVDVAKPADWASGTTGNFVTNIVSLEVSSNNVAGFQATMTTNENSTVANGTALVNTTDSDYYIPTLSGSNVAKNAFPTTGAWGFGLTAKGGSEPATYNPLVAKDASTPALILSSSTASSESKDIYFGTNLSSTGTGSASGTYERTVLISVVSGVHDDNTPITPANPTTPTTDPTNNDQGTVAYNTTNTAGTNTVYTNNYNTTTSGTTTEHTYSEITSGNNTSNYSGYAYPQGETNTVAAINEGTPLSTGLAVTASVAATAGVVFFILAKRKKDDDEEEDY